MDASARECAHVRPHLNMPGESGGRFLDGDTIWLQRAPELDGRLCPQLGHFFGSLQGNRQVKGKTQAGSSRWWQLNYLKTPGDTAHLASPVACPPRSPVLDEWVREMEGWLLVERRVEYGEAFCALTKSVRCNGLEGAVADVVAVSPVSRFSKLRAIQADCPMGTFDREEIFGAMAVNNFWQTSKGHHVTQGQPAFNLEPEPGSLWWDLLRHALPAPQRRIRSKASFAQAAVALSPNHARACEPYGTPSRASRASPVSNRWHCPRDVVDASTQTNPDSELSSTRAELEDERVWRIHWEGECRRLSALNRRLRGARPQAGDDLFF